MSFSEEITWETMEEKYEPRLHKFCEKDGDDFQLWSLKDKTTLKGGDLINALSSASMKLNINRGARSIILNALGDKLRRSVQEATNA